MTHIYCDCANLEQLQEAVKNPLVRGYTTNPTLMRRAGIPHYKRFALAALDIVQGAPISFEIFADDFTAMEYQAREISDWGGNVNVKIPVTTTKGRSTVPLINRLSHDGIVCNVTAVFTLDQVKHLLAETKDNYEMIISVFAGRVGDAGMDPVPHMEKILRAAKHRPRTKILWASPRQALDITLACRIGAHIITVTPELLARYEASHGKDLTEFSRDTVRMFYNDAQAAGYHL